MYILDKLIDKIEKFAENRRRETLLKTYGGIQKCPYCLQIMQTGNGCSSKEHPIDHYCDVLTCGVCCGESIWRFELGFIYVGPYHPPPAKHTPWNYHKKIHAPRP